MDLIEVLQGFVIRSYNGHEVYLIKLSYLVKVKVVSSKKLQTRCLANKTIVDSCQRPWTNVKGVWKDIVGKTGFIKMKY